MRPVVWTMVSGLFPSRILKNGRPGHAVVSYMLPDLDDGDSATWRKARAEVEIRLDDGTEPYTVRGVMNGDTKMAPFVRPGMSLPIKVKADKPKRLAIDWDAWKASGEFDAAKSVGDDRQAAQENVAAFEAPGASGPSGTAFSVGGDAPVREQVQQGPQFNAYRQRILGVVSTMTDAVRGGTMSRADLDEWLDEQVTLGTMTEAETAEARASLDGS